MSDPYNTHKPDYDEAQLQTERARQQALKAVDPKRAEREEASRRARAERNTAPPKGSDPSDFYIRDQDWHRSREDELLVEQARKRELKRAAEAVPVDPWKDFSMPPQEPAPRSKPTQKPPQR